MPDIKINLFEKYEIPKDGVSQEGKESRGPPVWF